MMSSVDSLSLYGSGCSPAKRMPDSLLTRISLCVVQTAVPSEEISPSDTNFLTIMGISMRESVLPRNLVAGLTPGVTVDDNLSSVGAGADKSFDLRAAISSPGFQSAANRRATAASLGKSRAAV